jgi:hypothetical protein
MLRRVALHCRALCGASRTRLEQTRVRFVAHTQMSIRAPLYAWHYIESIRTNNLNSSKNLMSLLNEIWRKSPQGNRRWYEVTGKGADMTPPPKKTAIIRFSVFLVNSPLKYNIFRFISQWKYNFVTVQVTKNFHCKRMSGFFPERLTNFTNLSGGKRKYKECRPECGAV